MENLSPQFLSGVDLFNSGRYYECHEALEELWLNTSGDERDFLHALVQTAAALHHLRRGNIKGARNIHQRAISKFAALPPVMMGLDTGQFANELEKYFSSINPDSDSPQIVLTAFKKLIDADKTPILLNPNAG